MKTDGTSCEHWQGGKCALPVCACRLETTDISHLELKDAHAEIGYSPYNKVALTGDALKRYLASKSIHGNAHLYNKFARKR